MLGNISHWVAGFCLIAIAAPTSLAQSNWADSLVDLRKMDFGVIATGSEAVKVVTITNSLQVQVHISSISTGCRCAEAGEPGKRLLNPGESTTMEVKMNTRSFKGQRDTSLSIYFDAPQFSEVRIPISAYIRTDVVFEPGKIDFGRLDYLAGGSTKVRIAYAGRSDWKIKDVRISSSELTAILKETSRSGGSVTYDLEMALAANTKPGRIRDIVTLVTDDAANPNVPLIVEATVVPDISISNPNVAIRSLRPGQTTVVKVVIQGNKPFLVEDVDCRKMQDCFEVKMSDKENKLQIVEMQFTAPDRTGKFSEEMIVKLKGRNDVLKFTVSGSITGG